MNITTINDVTELDMEREYAIYGAAYTGEVCLHILNKNGNKVCCFIDDDINKIGELFHGIEVLSLKKFMERFQNKRTVLILGSIYINVMCKRLMGEKFGANLDCIIYDMKNLYPKKSIVGESRFIKINNAEYLRKNWKKLYQIFSDEESRAIIETMKMVYEQQYLKHDVYDAICSDETKYFTDKICRILQGKKCNLLEGGAFYGELLGDIMNHNIHVNKAYLFEASAENYKILTKNIEKSGYKSVCVPINKGLWRGSGKLYLDGEGDQCRIVPYETENRIETTSIDEVVGDDVLDFIMMDIEGFELSALRGAEQTIKRCRPLLAITVYHSPEDFVGIPCYLSELLEDYEWNLMHHTNEYVETVLYGIPKEKWFN